MERKLDGQSGDKKQGRKRIREPRIKPRIGKIEIEYVDDPRLERELMRMILLALELSDKTPEEAEQIQKRFFE